MDVKTKLSLGRGILGAAWNEMSTSTLTSNWFPDEMGRINLKVTLVLFDCTNAHVVRVGLQVTELQRNNFKQAILQMA